jgi:glycosyltransferase involved in cell wall biosynthesis
MQKIRVGLQQRVIPAYRVPFIQELSKHPNIELQVFSGLPRADEMVASVKTIPEVPLITGNNLHFLRGSLYLCYQPDLLPWINSFDPQILIMEANPRYPSTRKALKWMHTKKRGLIGWGLGVPQHFGPLSQVRKISRLKFLNQFHALLAYSQLGRDQYISTGISPERVFVAPNATAGKPRKPAPVKPPTFENNRATLIYVGRLQPRKKIDSLIKCCAKLPEEKQPNLWIVGDGLILNDLKSLAKSVFPRTKFWGAVFGAELERLYQQADLFVLPGTGGLAIQEAMSFALPVIVAEGDGSQSNLITDANGWIVPPNDEEKLFSCINHAIMDPARLRTMGLAAYDVVMKKVNLEIMSEVFINTIEKVFKENPGV